MWWLRFFEAWAVAKLLNSSAFHRGVRMVERKVEHIRSGKPPEELGGTHLDDPNKPSLIKHFLDEVKDQVKGTTKK